MALSRRSTLREVVQTVSATLRRHWIEAVLTGGACASLHSKGDYLSHDLDYIIRNSGTRTQFGPGHAGRRLRPNRGRVPSCRHGIGDDDLVEPVEIRSGSVKVWTLSATDSCRDRLAAAGFRQFERELAEKRG